MIKYNLKCVNKHEFESWFSDSKEFEKPQLNEKPINYVKRVSLKKALAAESWIKDNKIVRTVQSTSQDYERGLKEVLP